MQDCFPAIRNNSYIFSLQADANFLVINARRRSGHYVAPVMIWDIEKSQCLTSIDTPMEEQFYSQMAWSRGALLFSVNGHSKQRDYSVPLKRYHPQ